MKKNQIVAVLVAAGVLTVGLVGYKLHTNGTLHLPSALVAMTPWGKKPMPLKRDFPSQNRELPSEPAAASDASPNATEATAPPGDNAAIGTSAVPVSADAGAGTAGAGAQGGAGTDVDSRIARAQELSRMLLDESPKPAAAATPVNQPAGKSGATGIAAYSGEWSGEFFGPDAGTVAVTIEPDGTAHGQGLSTMTSIGFALAGKVQSNGQVELAKSAAGVTSTGAVFSGVLSNAGQGKGTWFIPTYNLSGTWQMHAKSAP